MFCVSLRHTKRPAAGSLFYHSHLNCLHTFCLHVGKVNGAECSTLSVRNSRTARAGCRVSKSTRKWLHSTKTQLQTMSCAPDGDDEHEDLTSKSKTQLEEQSLGGLGLKETKEGGSLGHWLGMPGTSATKPTKHQPPGRILTLKAGLLVHVLHQIP